MSIKGIFELHQGHHKYQLLKKMIPNAIPIEILNAQVLRKTKLYYDPTNKKFITENTLKEFKQEYPYKIITGKKLYVDSIPYYTKKAVEYMESGRYNKKLC